MTHLHITGWVLGFILLAISYAMYKKGNTKAGKIVHMILRLDYLLILYSGGDLITPYFNGGSLMAEAIVKGVAGIWMIAIMEMILVRLPKEKPLKGLWTQFVIALIILLVLGFVRLPMGIQLG
ncbi:MULTISPECIES: YisL family protein [Virgibacillus]|uniref:UPF0344 protein A21D_02720 n=1 Tax=Virgibacillus dokdonensis TaxID=302167 RepID=A0A2K9J1K6_9BACI|nr:MULTISPECIES: YisL family protein [Virgibacillus]AUJ25766.1 hypothetical protein A21D_02720 [Virgibacillus dokdonensis]NWO13497.1 YisL family protein [Virgibacillus sp.]